MRRRLLVVEDDATLGQTLRFSLAREGYDVSVATTGPAALDAVRARRCDLVLLDVMLPGMSGVEVLRVMRQEGIETPVIIVSAKTEELDRVVGLKVGADDYVTKPFSRAELLARIEAVLRRGRRAEAEEATASEVLEFDGLRIDPERREVTLAGEALHLTTKEFDLLAHLAASPGRIFTRDQLLSRIWGFDYEGDTRTVDVHLSWLRTKLRGHGGHNWFRTVRGVGYAFAPPEP
ncbi:MAG TPA: response regulator transcription factor [Candidatus Limnocylindria bacterium]|nr:response regulator transcription factor [Candidatus Limnocylindria bacterium]